MLTRGCIFGNNYIMGVVKVIILVWCSKYIETFGKDESSDE